jgi:DNA repair protein RecN (Recombination protein N)
MLHELRVENLLLMEKAELRFGPGLNILTGETGAGKTLLTHALDLLFGGRARGGIVRDGAAEAYVEGIFSIPSGISGAELLPVDAEELVLARRVWPDGRTRAYVCGRSATLADLRQLATGLVSFYGQHQHRKLMLSTTQLELLDAHCGSEQLVARAQIAQLYEQVRELERRTDELCALARERDRELDFLAFELQEIDALAPTEAEESDLITERDRLRHQETLTRAAAAAADAIAPDAGGGAADTLADAASGLESVSSIDPALKTILERLEAIRYEAEDLGGELRRYLLGIESSPGRLEEVEERLEQFGRLQRKHGGSITEVIAHAERCRARADELEQAEVALEAAGSELALACGELERLAELLTGRRRAAAPKLAGAVCARLAELGLPDCQFEVEVASRAGGCGPSGTDAVELLIAPNAGLPAGPVREIASGGELSRVMLALLSVVHTHHSPDPEDAPLLVFDEIDAGIGGRTAGAVGRHLRQLARSRQIVCITHLPQVAALAGRHFTIVKDSSVVPARAIVTTLDGENVVSELVRMLGAGEGDRAASRHARQLLKAA